MIYIMPMEIKLMNEIVKYDNYMNNLNFKGFTTTDYNFLMMLCNKVRDKGTTEITISFQELKEKTEYKQHTIKQFVADLERMNDKLMKITCKLRTETKIIMFVLFPTFEIDIQNQVLIVSVNEKFAFILNELVKNFTRFDLQEFICLQSKYSKTLFRLLKQYKTTGRYETSVDKFREKMDIPKSYVNRDVTKIIDSSVKDLQNCFKDLNCTIQYANKRGKPVTGYIFTFKPEAIPKVTDKASDRVPQKRKTYQHKPSQKITNKFLNFEQHEYSEEELDEQERMLLERSRRKIRKLSDDIKDI